jgi:hypothetical protein
VSLEEEGIAREGKPRVARTAAEAGSLAEDRIGLREALFLERGVVRGSFHCLSGEA